MGSPFSPKASRSRRAVSLVLVAVLLVVCVAGVSYVLYNFDVVRSDISVLDDFRGRLEWLEDWASCVAERVNDLGERVVALEEGGGGGGGSDGNCSFVSFYVSGMGTTTAYYCLGSGSSTVESTVSVLLPEGNLTKLALWVSANSLVTSLTFMVRRNGGDSDLTFTVTTEISVFVSDTSSTLYFDGVDDYACLKRSGVGTGTVTGTFTFWFESSV